MDYLKRVARAFADDDPGMEDIARDALHAVEARIAALRGEGDVIRAMLTEMAREPRAVRRMPVRVEGYSIRPDGPVQAPETSARDAEGAGLSIMERGLINKLIEKMLADNPRVTWDEVVHAVKAAGIPLELRVKHPNSVVGTMLGSARRRMGIALDDVEAAGGRDGGQERPSATTRRMTLEAAAGAGGDGVRIAMR
jgi:hypothetical protein